MSTSKASFLASFLAKEGNKFFYRRTMPTALHAALGEKAIEQINLPLNATTRNAAEALAKELDKDIETIIEFIADKPSKFQRTSVLGNLTIMGILPPIKTVHTPDPLTPHISCPFCRLPMLERPSASRALPHTKRWGIRFQCGCLICGDMASTDAYVIEACPNENKTSNNTKPEASITTPAEESSEKGSYAIILTAKDDLRDYQIRSGTRTVNHVTRKEAVSRFFDECEKVKADWAILVKIDTKQVIASHKLEMVQETF